MPESSTVTAIRDAQTLRRLVATGALSEETVELFLTARRLLARQLLDNCRDDLWLAGLVAVNRQSLCNILPSHEDRDLFTRCAERLATSEDSNLSACCFLAMGMFEPVHLLPDYFPFDGNGYSGTGPLAAELVNVMTKKCVVLKYPNEPEAVVHYLMRLTNHLAKSLASGNFFLLPVELRKKFLYGVSFLPALSWSGSLQPLMTARAALLSQLVRLELVGQELIPVASKAVSELRRDQPRSVASNRPRARIGVLVFNFDDNANTGYVSAHIEALLLLGVEVSLFFLRPALDDVYLRALGGRLAQAMDISSLSLAEQINRIRSQALDAMLIGSNVVGHFDPCCRLALNALAREQVVLGASPCTTGMQSIDHVLTAASTESSDAGVREASVKEHQLLMDGLFCAFDPQMTRGYAVDAMRVQRVRQVLDGNGRFKALAFSNCNIVKLHRGVLDTWMRIAAANPQLRLVLAPFSPSWASELGGEFSVRQWIADLAARLGVDGDRVLILRPSVGVNEIRDVVEASDLCLDAWPFSSCSSLLWPVIHAKPFVCMDGTQQRSRQGAALAVAAGLSDCVAHSVEQYESIVQKLVNNESYRERLSGRLRSSPTASTLFDIPEFARRLERALLSDDFKVLDGHVALSSLNSSRLSVIQQAGQ